LQGDGSAERERLSRLSPPSALQFRRRRAGQQGHSGGADRTIQPTKRDEACEYCVVVSIINERGDKIARQVVGVGALQPGERHKYSFSVDVMPARGSGVERRRN